MIASAEKYKAFNTTLLLEQLAKQEVKPIVSLHLRKGISIYGFIISLDKTDLEGIHVCFQTEATKSLVFFHASDIIAIEVHQPEKIASLLSKGEIPRALNNDEKISLLQLKRWIKAECEALKCKHQDFDILLPMQNLSDTDRLNIKDIIGMVVEAINSVCSDTMGKDAWCVIESLQITLCDKGFSIDKSKSKHINLSIQYQKALSDTLASDIENALLNNL
ncbi:hypothetical protein [Flammeovirga pacifica]|uniref:Uncharacterized protein n=1 Tax=Flammeovirga pacifica TaxID=915059 RepID=A0A1S1YWL3_FLAPC|nr:hypothetical protein [Flammeovirga pacifica]OHX65410.1 hypothetical protein NH26_03125 [Flammeovirga pacifica]